MKNFLKEVGLFLGLTLAIFLGVLLAQTIKPKVITVIQPAEQVQAPDLTLGVSSSQNITATSSQITITATPTTLQDLIFAADTTLATTTWSSINYVVIQPTSGNIRYLVGGGTSFAGQTGLVAGTNGSIIYQSNKEPIRGNPREIYLVRDSAESSDVTAQVTWMGSIY